MSALCQKRTLAVQNAGPLWTKTEHELAAGLECTVRQLALFLSRSWHVAILRHGTLQCALERSIESTRNFGNLFVVKLAEQRRRLVVLESRATFLVFIEVDAQRRIKTRWQAMTGHP